MTRIRPCIDLHQGQVKQIVGSSLRTTHNESSPGSSGSNGDAVTATAKTPTAASSTLSSAVVNFASDLPASHFSYLYRRDELTGGHVILLGSAPDNVRAAKDALRAWPGGWQVGGGINPQNAREWLECGADKVIVTSYLFEGGKLILSRLREMASSVGKERLVIDVSCRRRSKDDPNYYVVTNKWQTFTDTPVTPETLQMLSGYCSELLVHAVDVEGKQSGIQQDLVEFLGRHSPVPVTYAGGVRNLSDLDLVEKLGGGRVDVTVGSALDIFGGSLPYSDVVDWHRTRNPATMHS
jgi:phosphoribosylformimino-5-aminoimidazole carboxamide ribotide isomerase